MHSNGGVIFQWDKKIIQITENKKLHASHKEAPGELKKELKILTTRGNPL